MIVHVYAYASTHPVFTLIAALRPGRRGSRAQGWSGDSRVSQAVTSPGATDLRLGVVDLSGLLGPAVRVHRGHGRERADALVDVDGHHRPHRRRHGHQLAIDAPLARWYAPLLLGPTCVVLALQGGYANWALATVFVLFFFCALKIIALVSGDYEARQRAHVLLERRAEELATAHESMRRLATYDNLTGLMNRRHMTLLLDLRAEVHRNGGDAFSIALVDLDHFKQINDAWSHAVGDEVLQGFADIARRALHTTPTSSRAGAARNS